MNGRSIDSNVYYLPVPTPHEPEPRLERPSAMRRWRNAWWRLRVAVAEIRAILKSRPRYSPQDYSILLDATEPLARVRERRRPARVIDFEMARVRLRATAEA